MALNNNERAFLELVKAGLGEEEVRLLPYGERDFSMECAWFLSSRD